MTTPQLSLVIADDHPIFRSGLRQIIERDPQLNVVAEASDGAAALALIRQHQPHIALLDVDLPKLDGLGVARAIAAENLAVRPVFLTMHADELYFQEALDTGAQGYLVKDSAATDVVQCLHAVASGRQYFSPTLSGHLLNRIRRATGFHAAQTGLDSLSPTERRVLALLGEMRTSKEIAAQLGVSPRTIENHRAHICEKLGLRGTHALVKFALQHKGE
jgi:DNA-binding NarL/FixJ family response regulator